MRAQANEMTFPVRRDCGAKRFRAVGLVNRGGHSFKSLAEAKTCRGIGSDVCTSHSVKIMHWLIWPSRLAPSTLMFSVEFL